MATSTTPYIYTNPWASNKSPWRQTFKREWCLCFCVVIPITPNCNSTNKSNIPFCFPSFFFSLTCFDSCCFFEMSPIEYGWDIPYSSCYELTVSTWPTNISLAVFKKCGPHGSKMTLIIQSLASFSDSNFRWGCTRYCWHKQFSLIIIASEFCPLTWTFLNIFFILLLHQSILI